ncbi:MAG: hypothetical protein ABI741_06395 [Ferruginibacter sp.]
MSNKNEKDQNGKDDNKDAAVKPDPKTLHTTDPQKKMQGPISSLMHEAGKSLDSDETREEADEKKEKNM